MNHWFLVGRDVMWFCIFMSPIILSSISVAEYHNPNGEALTVCAGMAGAIAIQIMLFICLWKGLIK